MCENYVQDKFNNYVKELKHFKMSSYKTNYDFFHDLVRKNKNRFDFFTEVNNRNKIIYFVDGPIGSGKSTLLRWFIMLKGLENLLFYSPEIYAELHNYGPDYLDAYNKAKQFLWQNVEDRIKTGESFIIESVFNKLSKVELLKDAKKCGYRLIGLYVSTENACININRVQNRVLEGSYYVPKDKIVSRYVSSMNRLPEIIDICDELLIIDNSKSVPKLIGYSYCGNFIGKLFEKQISLN